MRHIRWKTGAISGLLLSTALGLAACDHGSTAGGAVPTTSSSSSPPAESSNPSTTSAVGSASADLGTTAAPEDDTVNDDLRDYHRHHNHGGVSMFILMGADTLGLDPAKKAQIEKIQTDLRAKMAPARDIEHGLLSTIADGVAKGKIDTAKVNAAVAKLATSSSAIHGTTATAITQLHDALTPAERAALVDKVKAHWEVWNKVNTEEKSRSKEKGTHLAKLTALLNLTPEQVDKLTTALSADPPDTSQTDPKPVDGYIQTFATAFVADKFDPKSLAAPATAAAGHVAKQGATRMVRFYEAITPVLTPEQRAKLAAQLRERLDDQNAASGK